MPDYTKQSPGACTILRTFVITSGSLSLDTGKLEMSGGSETVTGPCNTPLFGEDKKRGICSACRRGWEVAANVFANEAEKTRATT